MIAAVIRRCDQWNGVCNGFGIAIACVIEPPFEFHPADLADVASPRDQKLGGNERVSFDEAHDHACDAGHHRFFDAGACEPLNGIALQITGIIGRGD
ncbi:MULTISPECIES: hypothetical protein [unclassified Rhizobium]|uniref:hypothetical protein n=1 Tax=unclassified Rhizobium TaxID=2613769 RepID=UPI00113174DF|nr:MULTISPECIES: hypothetical protein [unclassified Rhizobium]